jgi:hypothetical protein
MTVCAAMICKYGDKDVLLGVSDRKYVSEDIEFESGLRKIYGFGPPHRTIAMGAGNTEAYHAIDTDVHRQIANMASVPVREIARLYAVSYMKLRRERAEQLYLAPLGLDTTSFNEKQKTMEPSLVRRLTRQLQSKRLDVSAIIAGYDENSPHIYSIEEPGKVSCWDHSGFCAIGSGGRQFETFFMLAGYDRSCPYPYALLLACSAKIRAESSPHVGRGTDVWDIGGVFDTWLPDSAVEALKEHVRKMNDAFTVEREKTVHNMLQDTRIFAAMTNPSPSSAEP